MRSPGAVHRAAARRRAKKTHHREDHHVAGDTDRIEQEIAKAREDLAHTLDALAERTSPQRLADDAKTKALATLNTPAVKYSLAGVGALVLVLVIRKVVVS